MGDVPLDVRDPVWGRPALPEWVTALRPHQVDAIQQCLDAYRNGAKVVFLDAPTGSGKTLIGEAVRRLLCPGRKTVYTCSTLTLQDQFLHDFPYAAVLKGRSNYPTEMVDLHPDAHCGDCTDQSGPGACQWCYVQCPYRVARDLARVSQLAVLNTAYLLTVWNTSADPQGLFKGKTRDLFVIDEADLLEQALMNYAEVRVPGRIIKKLRLGHPDRKTVRDSWAEWVSKARDPIAAAAGRIHSKELSALRERQRLERIVGQLDRLSVDLNTDMRWIYQPDADYGSAVFKPVTTDQLGAEYLWRHGRRYLLMSASLISSDQMATDLGLPEDMPYETVTVPSTFDVARRPVHVANVGSMGRKQQAQTMPRLLDAIVKVVNHHPGERVLVHTVSYRLAKEVNDYLTSHLAARIVVTYTEGAGREAALLRYLANPGAVMVAPSMDRGVDLPDNLCRVQVIAKVPYPSLGDEQVKARLYGTGPAGQIWYSVQTVRTIVQMTGRAVRSANDHATTYILDGNFVSLFRQWERLFPTWWKEAVVWDGTAKRNLGL